MAAMRGRGSKSWGQHQGLFWCKTTTNQPYPAIIGLMVYIPPIFMVYLFFYLKKTWFLPFQRCFWCSESLSQLHQRMPRSSSILPNFRRDGRSFNVAVMASESVAASGEQFKTSCYITYTYIYIYTYTHIYIYRLHEGRAQFTSI